MTPAFSRLLGVLTLVAIVGSVVARSWSVFLDWAITLGLLMGIMGLRKAR